MKENIKVIGLGLGFSLLTFYCHTGIPFDMAFLEEG
jgi:hypothetical protein